MEVGYQVGQVVPRGSMDLQDQWQFQLKQFKESRDAGFDMYCWAHHYLIDPFQHFQPFPVLSRLAAEPGNMKLATSILVLPLLNPVDVAEQAATLDHISGGRFTLGIGLGYRPEECEAFGTKMSERGARAKESLEIIKRLWTEDNVTHEGKFWKITDAKPTAKPYQKPHLPIWQAAMSDRAVKRVAASGDILYIGPANSYSTIKRHVELYHETLQANDKEHPGDMVVVREFYAANTRQEALDKARWGFKKKYDVYAMHGMHGVEPELVEKVAPMQGTSAGSGNSELETLMDDTFIFGSGEECIHQIGQYRELGFTHIAIRLFYPGMSENQTLEHIDYVGQNILPTVKRM